MKSIAVFTSLILCVSVYAKPIEMWECQQDSFSDWRNILVVATVEEGRQKGSIEVAGISHVATFSIQGFDRRWDFGQQQRSGGYSFVVRPDGSAMYYDFRLQGPTKPSNFMFCRKRLD
jgi:hypothetical protein